LKPSELTLGDHDPPSGGKSEAGDVSPASSGSAPARTTSVERRSTSVAPSTEPITFDPVVRVSSLTKRYGEVVAVDDLTFSLAVGTITAFLGPNGAGKTTTLKLLLGLAEPTAGEALVFGRRYRELDRPACRVGAVLESSDFHPGRSGRDHVRALAFAAEIPARRVDEVLELVELTADGGRRVGTYSLGMRQRLGLAAALLGDPELLVLDEPANGLDPAGVHWLRSFLRSFAENGRTVLVSSHVLAEMSQVVDQVLIVVGGRLVAEAGLDDLTRGGRTLEEVYLGLTGGAL
ncbi:MAG: ATP-binding cassette domain-containing protein, partial [Actinomycetota bacterium]|nr:ATP-binding cassette domain-containing protein [Actinomycetota bacterium]